VHFGEDAFVLVGDEVKVDFIKNTCPSVNYFTLAPSGYAVKKHLSVVDTYRMYPRHILSPGFLSGLFIVPLPTPAQSCRLPLLHSIQMDSDDLLALRPRMPPGIGAESPHETGEAIGGRCWGVPLHPPPPLP
jgi:hypothetical protein